MELPKLPEGLTWRVYDWQDDKFIGIVPSDGYEWKYNIGFSSEVSAYSKRLKKKTTEAVLETAIELHDFLFDGTMVIPPESRLIGTGKDYEIE